MGSATNRSVYAIHAANNSNNILLRSNIISGDSRKEIAMVCPITLESMLLEPKDLSAFANGDEAFKGWIFKATTEPGMHVYIAERGIAEWIAQEETCPLTRKPLSDIMLKPIQLAEIVKAEKWGFINTIASAMSDEQREKLLRYAKKKGFTKVVSMLEGISPVKDLLCPLTQENFLMSTNDYERFVGGHTIEGWAFDVEDTGRKKDSAVPQVYKWESYFEYLRKFGDRATSLVTRKQIPKGELDVDTLERHFELGDKGDTECAVSQIPLATKGRNIATLRIQELVEADEWGFINAIAVKMSDSQRDKFLIYAKKKGFTKVVSMLLELQAEAKDIVSSADRLTAPNKKDLIVFGPMSDEVLARNFDYDGAASRYVREELQRRNVSESGMKFGIYDVVAPDQRLVTYHHEDLTPDQVRKLLDEYQQSLEADARRLIEGNGKRLIGINGVGSQLNLVQSGLIIQFDDDKILSKYVVGENGSELSRSFKHVLARKTGGMTNMKWTSCMVGTPPQLKFTYHSQDLSEGEVQDAVKAYLAEKMADADDVVRGADILRDPNKKDLIVFGPMSDEVLARNFNNEGTPSRYVREELQRRNVSESGMKFGIYDVGAPDQRLVTYHHEDLTPDQVRKLLDEYQQSLEADAELLIDNDELRWLTKNEGMILLFDDAKIMSKYAVGKNESELSRNFKHVLARKTGGMPYMKRTSCMVGTPPQLKFTYHSQDLSEDDVQDAVEAYLAEEMQRAADVLAEEMQRAADVLAEEMQRAAKEAWNSMKCSISQENFRMSTEDYERFIKGSSVEGWGFSLVDTERDKDSTFPSVHDWDRYMAYIDSGGVTCPNTGLDITVKGVSSFTEVRIRDLVGAKEWYFIKTIAEDMSDLQRNKLLRYAAQESDDKEGFTKVVSLLLELETDVNAPRADDGMTALMYAAEKGNARMVELLLEAGADTQIRNRKYKAAYRFAEGEALKVLMMARDIEGRTPLMDAAQYGLVDVVTKLINAGAEVGETWSDITRWWKFHSPEHPEVVGALLKGGAKAGASEVLNAARWGKSAEILQHLANNGAMERMSNDECTETLKHAAMHGNDATFLMLVAESGVLRTPEQWEVIYKLVKTEQAKEDYIGLYCEKGGRYDTVLSIMVDHYERTGDILYTGRELQVPVPPTVPFTENLTRTNGSRHLGARLGDSPGQALGCSIS